ncbi:hypothetical protein KHA80_22420 [Anaerobacillus sp. HL2]|nr:hypothetical protein KHA80_22420 [Anaerobacillus sp. HL2]
MRSGLDEDAATNLSGGEKQIRVLIMKPDILLLDRAYFSIGRKKQQKAIMKRLICERCFVALLL